MSDDNSQTPDKVSFDSTSGSRDPAAMASQEEGLTDAEAVSSLGVSASEAVRLADMRGTPAARMAPLPLLPGPLGVFGIVSSGTARGAPDGAPPDGMMPDGIAPHGIAGDRTIGRITLSGGTVTALSPFLSLYLVLMAFFIALVSLSDLQEERSKAVMTAMQATFAGQGQAQDPFPSDGGDVFAPARDFVADLGQLFETQLPGAAVTTLLPGPVLEASVPVESLFLPASDRPRESAVPLLQSMAAALAASPNGVMYEMVIAVHGDGLGLGGEGETAAAPDLALRRASALAEYLIAAGAPGMSVVAALTPGPLGRLSFTGRALTEGSL